MKKEPTMRDALTMVAVTLIATALLIVMLYHEINRDPYYTPSNTKVELTEAEIEAIKAEVDAEYAEWDVKPESVSRVDLDTIIEQLILVENPMRDVDAVGDQHLENKAYGLLQIRQPYLDDVNKIAGTNYSIEDMKDPALAKWAAKVYLNHYGNHYQRKTGNEPTLEVYARIHNGGPNGWKKSSTNEYVMKLKREISK